MLGPPRICRVLGILKAKRKILKTATMCVSSLMPAHCGCYNISCWGKGILPWDLCSCWRRFEGSSQLSLNGVAGVCGWGCALSGGAWSTISTPEKGSNLLVQGVHSVFIDFCPGSVLGLIPAQCFSSHSPCKINNASFWRLITRNSSYYSFVFKHNVHANWT